MLVYPHYSLVPSLVTGTHFTTLSLKQQERILGVPVGTPQTTDGTTVTQGVY